MIQLMLTIVYQMNARKLVDAIRNEIQTMIDKGENIDQLNELFGCNIDYTNGDRYFDNVCSLK